jgi:hypothetical protein
MTNETCLDSNGDVISTNASSNCLFGNGSGWGGGSDDMVVAVVGDVATGIGLYVLSFLTFVGNAMVLHAIRTEKRLQTVRKRERLFL